MTVLINSRSKHHQMIDIRC